MLLDLLSFVPSPLLIFFFCAHAVIDKEDGTELYECKLVQEVCYQIVSHF